MTKANQPSVLSDGIDLGDVSDVSDHGEVDVEDLVTGEGAEVADESTVTVHYRARLEDGALVDDSHGGDPLTFTVGDGEVIPGWEQGVLGMRVGGTRRLVVPADLAYRQRGVPGRIPPGATLVFEITLLAAKGDDTT